MQKIFSQELRFKDDNGNDYPEWEEKLGELSQIVRGASPRPIKDPKWFNKESDIGWLRISDVTDQNGKSIIWNKSYQLRVKKNKGFNNTFIIKYCGKYWKTCEFCENGSS